MIVVADTGPLNYLLAVRQIEILPRLFGVIIIPQTVAGELRAPGAPETNLRWLATLPPEFELRTASAPLPHLGLARGETEAIALAEELRAAAILMDERKGRRAAVARGHVVVGTLGVLERAGANGWLDLEAVFEQLRMTTFFAPDELMDAALERWKKLKP